VLVVVAVGPVLVILPAAETQVVPTMGPGVLVAVAEVVRVILGGIQPEQETLLVYRPVKVIQVVQAAVMQLVVAAEPVAQAQMVRLMPLVEQAVSELIVLSQVLASAMLVVVVAVVAKVVAYLLEVLVVAVQGVVWVDQSQQVVPALPILVEGAEALEPELKVRVWE